jgi:response regulator RpfG family c-di-GMP phosphodiesterase
LDRQENFPVFMAVVDDEIDLASLFKDALSQIPNVQVFAFSDPLLALEHFQHNQKYYLCIISDYRMPGLNGVELLSKIKQINHEVTSILISAFEIDNETSKNCNFIDKFLQKPITMGDLLTEVRKYISKVEVQKQER